MKKFYSVSEIANIFGVSRQYIWMQIQLKKIKAKKIVGRYVISQTEFDRIKILKKIKGGNYEKQ
jgi:excisionase family DNA binding protein